MDRSTPGVAAGSVSEPGGTADSAALALRDPDEYAWQLFLYLNRQAAGGSAGVADSSKTITQYDPDTDTIWETWALSSGLDIGPDPSDPSKPKVLTNQSEVFKNPATQPVPWEKLERTTKTKILSPDFKTALIAAGAPSSGMNKGLVRIEIAPPGTNPEADESRMNRSTYDTIRAHRLYSTEGIEIAIAEAKKARKTAIVSFEPFSKEVKARWKHLAVCDTNPKCPDRARYHWRSVSNPKTGKQEIWGLVSLHIISKDLPNWFWADFGHVDCEEKKGACSDEEAAQTPLRDSTTRTSGGIRKETVGSKWQYYRLRGTQIDFVSPTGIDTILSNPVIEGGFQVSSCITCHSYASAGAAASVPPSGTSLPLVAGQVGVRNAGAHGDDTGRSECQRFFTPRGQTTGKCPGPLEMPDPLYFQTDFLWSIPFRAFSEKP